MISILTDVTHHRLAEVRAEKLRNELVEASHRAGMAEIATGVLHNVGNVLNSVNVSAEAFARALEDSRLSLLGRAVALIEGNEDRLVELLTEDAKGRQLPALLGRLQRGLEAERQQLFDQVSRMRQHIELMRSRGLAKLGGMVEPTRPDELVRQTLSMFQLDLESRVVELTLELEDVGTVLFDKQAALQVLANLIRNAIEALEGVDRRYFDVQDNGCGIAQEHLTRMFQHGFSTKPSGHGFGLRSSAIAAQTMNGALDVHSDGLGRGARFRFTLPKIHP
jgi:signal transduction histidine kinase